MAGLTSVPFMGPYNVAKHGVVTLSETLFHELAMLHPEIGVTVVCPGWVKTKIHESERNRPDGVERRIDLDAPEDPSSAFAGMGALVSGLIAGGLDPLDVARRVLDAVREDRFYVLTHESWSGGVTHRTELIVSGQNPELVFPGND
jgi:short-subunit dehydrogenase